MWFQIYFVVQVITNVVFVAYYTVMAFKQRDACSHTVKKEDGSNVDENVSSTFAVSFIVGFAMHSINFTIGTFIEPCLRLVSLSKPSKDSQPQYSTVFVIGVVCDLVFRFGFLTFSVAQIALLGSEGVKHCSSTKDALGYDANWMQSLAVAQLVAIPTFFFWRYFAKFSFQ